MTGRLALASLELRIPPLLVGAGFAGAMYGLAALLPRLSVTVPLREATALSLLAAGVLVAIAGVVAFRRHRTTVNPLDPSASSCVVTGGIYAVSRNPMYLGFALVLAAWAAQLSSIPAALLLPGFVGYLTRFQIQPEERALLAKFGAPFEEYMSRVRRWV